MLLELGGAKIRMFWAKVKTGPLDQCWPWMGRIRTKKLNYGVYQFAKAPKSRKIAHRFAWELAWGEWPGALMVCHRCDNPPCCNPAHLFLGTATDNNRDRERKGRGVRQRGITHPQAKMTEAEVLAIRADTRRLAVIGEEYGLSATTVSQIRRRKSWKHLVEGTR